MNIAKDDLLSCITTQLVQISGGFADCSAAAQDAFVAMFDHAMTASMRLLEQRLRGFVPELVLRWGNPTLRGQLQIRRGTLEWVDE